MPVSANNVNVQLRDDVADGGDVDLVGFKMRFDKMSDGIDVLLGLCLLLVVESVVLSLGSIGDQDEPGKQGIF